MAKIEGKTIQLGGQEYVLPPLPLAMMGRFQRAQAQFSQGDFDTAAAELIECTHAALQRNYPDLAADVVRQHLDLGNFQQVIQALAAVSGFVAATGEVTALP